MKILQREQREIWFRARMKSVLCLCMCGVSLTVTSDALRCNHRTLSICHPHHGEETLDRLQCRLRNQRWSEWRTCPWSAAVHQSATCDASFLCMHATDPPPPHTHTSFKCIKLFAFSFEPEGDYAHWYQPCMMLIMRLQFATFLILSKLVLATNILTVSWQISVWVPFSMLKSTCKRKDFRRERTLYLMLACLGLHLLSQLPQQQTLQAFS